MSRTSPILIAVALVLLETRLDNPLRLLRTFLLACVAPGLAAWLLARAFAVAVSIGDGVLVLARRDERIEIPLEAVVRLVPWTVPLPGSGVWLELRSGRRFSHGLQVDDPVRLAHALVDAGAPATARAAADARAALYAASRGRRARAWWHPLLKYVVYSLVPAVPIFRLHQWIVYGGTFGEYYTYGLQAYLLGFAAYWWSFAIRLVLWDAVLRTLAEAAVLAMVWAAPAGVASVRRTVELLHRIAYYGGVPLFLLRVAFLAS